MKFLINSLLFCLSIVLLLSSCGKDVDEFNVVSSTPIDDVPHDLELGEDVLSSVGGVILNENNEPFANVYVSSGGVTASTDANGVFLLRNVPAKERLLYVKAEKSGYFLGSRTIVPSGNADAVDFVKIKMIPKVPVGNINSLDGGTVAFQGVELTLPANGYIDGDGNPYSGNVNVAAYFLSPEATDLGLIMPGDLRGQEDNGRERALMTYGMFAVQLTGNDGVGINLDGVAEAEISSPVPSSLLGSAPAKLPMWHFDEELGLWQEESFAELVGDRYVGKVTHFSFWNHDFQGPLIDFKGRVVDQNGYPIVGVDIRIDMVSDPYRKGWGVTNGDGVFCGIIPQNEDLVITVWDPCGNEIYSEPIGPFADSTNLDDIVVSFTTSTVFVTGELVDCNNNPVSNGYVSITDGAFFPNLTLWVDANGDFQYHFNACNDFDTLTIQGWDLDNELQSLPATYQVVNDTVQAVLQACNQLDEYLEYNLNGMDFLETSIYFFQDSVASGGIGAAISSGQNTVMPDYIYFSWEPYGQTGTHDLITAFAEGQTLGFADADNVGTVTVTYFGGSGDFLEGTFTTTLTGNSNQYPFSGSFRVRVP